MTRPSILSVNGAVITHRGSLRDQNEDAALLGGRVFAGSNFDQPRVANTGKAGPWVVAVADGIGGANGGSVASRQLVEWLEQCPDKSTTGIVELLKKCNASLFELGRDKPELAAMGAAVAGIVNGAEGLFAFNVGDCRVYRVRDQFLQQITRDDSAAQLLVDAGLAELEASRSEKLRAITQAIGGRFELKDIDPHVYLLRLARTSRFLICTDGLTDMIDLDGLEEAMRGRATPADAAAALFDFAMAAGGKDNITIIVADVSVEKEEGANRHYGNALGI
jgi:serine/threonine protein phosphatase PrpC